jgi:hypothetical protein
VTRSQDGSEPSGPEIPEADMQDMAGRVGDQNLAVKQWSDLTDAAALGIFSGGGRESLTRNASHRFQTGTRQHGSLSITEYAPVLPTPWE